jgi:hypothetical protein
MKRFLSSAACRAASIATLTATLMAALPASAQTTAIPAVINAAEVSIGGIGPGVDAKAFAKVRMLIAGGVYDSTVAYFDVSGYGKEGGFSACIEKGRLTQPGAFEKLVKTLKLVRVDKSTTAYNVTPVDHCTYRTAP